MNTPPTSTTTTTATTTVVVETTTTDVTMAPEPAFRSRAADLPAPRTEVAGAVWEDRIIVVGGLDELGAASERTDIYDPDTDTWAAGPDLPVALHHTGVATMGERVYVVGGYADPGGWTPQQAVWSLGPDEESWQPEPDLVTPRGALAVVSTGDRLVAMGGVGPGGAFLTSTEILESGEEGWRSGPS